MPRSDLVARYFDLTEAQVAAGVLRASGLNQMLRDENTCSIDWSYLVALGGVSVETTDSEEAAALLSSAADFEREIAALRAHRKVSAPS